MSQEYVTVGSAWNMSTVDGSGVFCFVGFFLFFFKSETFFK